MGVLMCNIIGTKTQLPGLPRVTCWWCLCLYPGCAALLNPMSVRGKHVMVRHVSDLQMCYQLQLLPISCMCYQAGKSYHM